MIEIPVVNFKIQSSDYEMVMDFEAVSVTIRLTYNTRNNYWYINLSTNLSSIQSVKGVVNSLLIDQYKASLLDIKGDFIIRKIADNLENQTLTYDNFGVDWAFQYLTANEVEEYKIEKELV